MWPCQSVNYKFYGMIFYFLCRQLRKPDTSKLKWTRNDDAVFSDGVTKTTKATRSIPMPSTCNDILVLLLLFIIILVSRKRRRSSSSGGNGSFSKSPFIIKRYQLVRRDANAVGMCEKALKRKIHVIIIIYSFSAKSHISYC